MEKNVVIIMIKNVPPQALTISMKTQTDTYIMLYY